MNGWDLAVYGTYFQQGTWLSREHISNGEACQHKGMTTDMTAARVPKGGNTVKNKDTRTKLFLGVTKALRHRRAGRTATNEGEGDKVHERNSDVRQGRQAPSR